MYRYDDYDHQMLADRVNQFRGQTQRFLEGKLTDAEFLPLRLQNGLYIQRLAPMLRIAVPYGLLSSRQMRQLAYISNHYDNIPNGVQLHLNISSVRAIDMFGHTPYTLGLF